MALTKQYVDRIEGLTPAKDIQTIETVMTKIYDSMLNEGFEACDFVQYMTFKAEQIKKLYA